MTGSILELKLDNASKVTPVTGAQASSEILTPGVTVPAASNITIPPVRSRRLLSLILAVLVLLVALIGYYRYSHRSLIADLIGSGIISKDSFTAGAVSATFLLNKQLSDEDITVTSREGVVTLTGQVGSWDERQIAEELAYQCRGVNKVVNKLELTEEGKTRQLITDLALQAKVLEALLASDELKGQRIAATVNNYVVTLTGTVASEALQKKASDIVSDISGVRAVNNQITLIPPAETKPIRAQ